MRRFSIIIVNFNTRQLLLDCLRSVVETTVGEPVEIWVVDNASSDGSVAAVKAAFPEVHVIENDTNRGFAGANNQALAQSSGDVLVLLNPDTVVRPGTFAALLQTFKSDAAIGVVGPQLLNLEGTLQPSCGSFASAWTEFLFQSFLFKLIPSPFPLGPTVHPMQRGQYERRRRVDWVTGACLSIRREAVTRIGLLDESFFMYGEDMEWCWRVKRAGYTVCYQPVAKVVHYSRQASQQDYRAWIMRYTRGQLRFISQTRSRFVQLLFGVWICLGSLLRIGLWAALGWFDSARIIETRQRTTGYREAFAMGWKSVLGKSL